jgi:hypothetical protein
MSSDSSSSGTKSGSRPIPAAAPKLGADTEAESGKALVVVVVVVVVVDSGRLLAGLDGIGTRRANVR